MPVSVVYNLTGAGGSECRVVIGERSAHLTASYLSGALGDLPGAGATLGEGAVEATASFEAEPGEYRWRFRRLDDGQVHVRILSFADSWDQSPDERGKIVFEARCRLRTFAGAVLAASQEVLRQHGLEGYRSK